MHKSTSHFYTSVRLKYRKVQKSTDYKVKKSTDYKVKKSTYYKVQKSTDYKVQKSTDYKVQKSTNLMHVKKMPSCMSRKYDNVNHKCSEVK